MSTTLYAVGAWFSGPNDMLLRIESQRTVIAGDSAVADRRIGGTMCGNELAGVRAGRFSDGRHREVAFMLWTTPSIGAWTSIYCVGGAGVSLA
jgi:hypothetical protein